MDDDDHVEEEQGDDGDDEEQGQPYFFLADQEIRNSLLLLALMNCFTVGCCFLFTCFDFHTFSLMDDTTFSAWN